ncbi:UNVERIFIED_CONTAM: hypothetical protein Sangu_2676400 [Sesamum angustifolium]|uniref:Uncharacterized protein n=1 Tax=Sesamum angustifolium TaxID=2727405 RepID=A0AAW2J0G0_9LAMI
MHAQNVAPKKQCSLKPHPSWMSLISRKRLPPKVCYLEEEHPKRRQKFEHFLLLEECSFE